MADQAKTDANATVAFFFYTASTGQILPFLSIDAFNAVDGLSERQAILSEINIQGGTPQSLLSYDVLATAIALKTSKGENFPDDVEAKLTALSNVLVSNDALTAAWLELQDSHITNAAKELLDVPAERSDLIAQIIANNSADFVSTEVAAETGEMTVSFIADTTDAVTEPETEEVVEEVAADPTLEEETEVETNDPETEVVGETTEVSALSHYEASENGIMVTEGNVEQLLSTFADMAYTQKVTAETQANIAKTQADMGTTLGVLAANLTPKTSQTVPVDAEVVTPPAEA